MVNLLKFPPEAPFFRPPRRPLRPGEAMLVVFNRKSIGIMVFFLIWSYYPYNYYTFFVRYIYIYMYDTIKKK